MRAELVTTLKRQATELLSDLERSKQPILVTQHGLPSAYLVDVETYELVQQRMNVLEAIASGEQAVAVGRVVTHHQAKARLARWLRVGSESAPADLEAIPDYIALENPAAAAELVQRVLAHVEQLAEHPQSGVRVPELGRSRHRQLVLPPCRVFYRHDGQGIFIVQVMPCVHERRIEY